MLIEESAVVNNVLAELVVEVPIREELKDLRNNIETSYVEMAKKLHEVWAGALFVEWGFQNFKEYVEDELGINVRRCQYMVAIAETVQRLNISWEDLRGIGWTKARIISPMLGTDKSDKTTEEWIELANNSSVKVLESHVKDAKKQADAVDSIRGDEDKSNETKYTFFLQEEQLKLLVDALDTAKEVYDVKKDTEALENILYQWSSDNAGGMTSKLSLEEMIKYVERSYAVSLEVVGEEEISDILQ